MNVWEVIACAMALCLAGMLLLSQAMDRHCDQLMARGAPGPLLRAVLRLLAAALMALALWYCIGGWGASVGTVAWLGWLSVSALLVAWLLSYAPRSGAVVIALAGMGALAWTLMRGLAA